MFWWVTLLMLGMLVVAGGQHAQRARAQATDNDGLDTLPAKLRRLVGPALEQLEPGDARRLLIGVVQPARALMEHTASANTPGFSQTQRDVLDLVEDATAIALDVARLDQATRHLDSADESLRKRCEPARALFAKRLADASTVLTELYASTVEQGTPATDRAAELVVELRAEAEARRQALAELLGETLPGVRHA